MNDSTSLPIARQQRPPAMWLALATVVFFAGHTSFTASKNHDGGADDTDAELVELSRQVYGTQCASCHGATLQGHPTGASACPQEGCRRRPTTKPGTPGTIRIQCCLR